MKKFAIATLCVAMFITVFAGCGSKGEKATKTPDLKGEWKQTNSESDDSYQTATIKDDSIEIYWVSDDDDSKSLYWAGSYVAPKNADEPYKWDSKNDHSKTESSLLASSDDTKALTYKDGVLSYEASAMGSTTTVKLEKQK